MKSRRINLYKSAKNATYRVRNGLKSVGSSVASNSVPVVKKGFFNLFGLLKSGVNNTSSSIKSLIPRKRHHKRRHHKSYRRRH
jgi:hypothetical protein